MDRMTEGMKANLAATAAWKTWQTLTDPQRRLAREIATAPGGEMVVPGTRGATAKVLRERGVIERVRDPSVHRIVTAFADFAQEQANDRPRDPAIGRPRCAALTARRGRG
jgi:hypothetical protein